MTVVACLRVVAVSVVYRRHRVTATVLVDSCVRQWEVVPMTVVVRLSPVVLVEVYRRRHRLVVDACTVTASVGSCMVVVVEAAVVRLDSLSVVMVVVGIVGIVVVAVLVVDRDMIVRCQLANVAIGPSCRNRLYARQLSLNVAVAGVVDPMLGYVVIVSVDSCLNFRLALFLSID